MFETQEKGYFSGFMKRLPDGASTRRTPFHNPWLRPKVSFFQGEQYKCQSALLQEAQTLLRAFVGASPSSTSSWSLSSIISNKYVKYFHTQSQFIQVFHKQHFKEERKLQLAAAQENIFSKKEASPILMQSDDQSTLDRKSIQVNNIIEKRNLHQINKIPSKQRRWENKHIVPTTKVSRYFSPNSALTELEEERKAEHKQVIREKHDEVLSLEKYIDSEIYVPRILHEENLIKSLVVESKIPRGTGAEGKVKLQNEQKRKFDLRLQKDIDDIEKRLGLKKQDIVVEVQKFLNTQATSKNIDLLGSALKREHRQQHPQSSYEVSMHLQRISPQQKLTVHEQHQQAIASIVNSNNNNIWSRQIKNVQDIKNSFEFLSPLQTVGKRRTLPSKPPAAFQHKPPPQDLTLLSNDEDFDIPQPPVPKLVKTSPHVKSSFYSMHSSRISPSTQQITTSNTTVPTTTLSKSVLKQSPRLQTIESKFFPEEHINNQSIKQLLAQSPSKVKIREARNEIKKILIKIIDETCNINVQPHKRGPPSFYDMIMRKNGASEPLIPDKTQMRRVLHLLQRWYKYKDPFTDKSISVKHAEAISNVYLKRPTLRQSPILKHSNQTGLLRKKYTIHNIHDDPETTSDSMMSDEDVELYIRDEEDFTLNVSDSDTSQTSTDSDSALLDIEDERQLMVRIQSRIKKHGINTRLDVLVKCLNMILLHKSDPFLAKKHTEYLRCMRRKRKEEKEKTFYERMQEDIRKREEAVLRVNKLREEREKREKYSSIDTTRRGTIYRIPTGMSQQTAIKVNTSSNNTPVNSVKFTPTHHPSFNPRMSIMGGFSNHKQQGSFLSQFKRRQTTVKRLIDFQEIYNVSGILPQVLAENQQSSSEKLGKNDSVEKLQERPLPRKSRTKQLQFKLTDEYVGIEESASESENAATEQSY